jgi:hypothetical protein
VTKYMRRALEDEIERLREANTALLAACETVRLHMLAGRVLDRTTEGDVFVKLDAVLAKAGGEQS